MIHDAIKARHPEITVIGTVGPDPSGLDYDAGWKFANEQHLEMVDEHGYKPPQWFFDNLTRFDSYDRTASKVYLGEYAAHDKNRANTLRSALAEAAYMTSLERNGDLVRLASYAPLLGKEGHMQWQPDMIYFNNTRIVRTANYYVQQMFSVNQGDLYLPSHTSDTNMIVSVVEDAKTGDVIAKLVNVTDSPVNSQFDFAGGIQVHSNAVTTVLAGDLASVNSFDKPQNVAPATSAIEAGNSFAYEIPAHSLTVIRMNTR
jgi:alpha-L-arabinofuranosidase